MYVSAIAIGLNNRFDTFQAPHFFFLLSFHFAVSLLFERPQRSTPTGQYTSLVDGKPTMTTDRRRVKHKIQRRRCCWDISSQPSLLESCPPNKKSQDGLQSYPLCHNPEVTATVDSTRTSTMSIHQRNDDRFGILQRSKKNFRAHRPEPLDMSQIFDVATSSSVVSATPIARHASNSEVSFFPSPRSVLERRTSSGSFF